MITPRTPSGVLELLPAEQIAFQRMLDTIRAGFERFGFLPVETPAFEVSDVLLTKTGGETERQVYFVQSTGSLEKAADGDSGARPEMALRFDLTVPLARYVAEHEHELTFPFRRYQMQRVYRGERAQRGRFREFYQCDIDIIGKDHLSVRHDAECPAVIHALFADLDIGPVTIGMNNRRLMRGCFQRLGLDDPALQGQALREVDKLDKRGEGHVRAALSSAPFDLDPGQVQELIELVGVRSTSHADAMAHLDRLAALPGQDAELEQGVAELREVLELVRALGVPESDYCLNLSIARGLDYYTGTVYETTLDEHPGIGSICSGGRYDELARHYTRSSLPGVGISIGLTRLFWQLREAGLLHVATSTVQVLVPLVDAGLMTESMELTTTLRRGGINTESVLEGGKLGRQLRYADRAGIRFVAILGPAEVAEGTVTLRDLWRQDQYTVPLAEAVRTLRVELAQPRV
ncbi:MAG TPA: histidine--tRNA ligase [Ornithinimicrobium sp.]|uniref:histidine--tRNA ligase n=1 Tax=Ornithinimicrobium sp. TaxID=1977084 RepID=UPI002B46ACF4|nr:histidine--tRNA ligase [Ornithinimicrobium sp.]HKJ11777.1 histidine--tRNA ligase [Ornithinimicrobium sp.]